MPTNHWLTSGVSLSGVLTSGGLPPVTLSVPAGGRVVRFQARGCYLIAERSDIGFNNVSPGVVGMNVFYQPAGSSPRQIYTTRNGVPMAVAALYDPATLQRVYSAYYAGGDRDFAVNQSCSYGKHSGAFPATVTFDVSLLWGTGLSGPDPAGQFGVDLAVLYDTVP